MEVLKIVLVVAGGIAVLCAFACIAIQLEKQSFNNCRCIRCGYPLRHFDNDSHGGRGYICDKCGYVTWVSYNGVDKNYGDDKDDYRHTGSNNARS